MRRGPSGRRALVTFEGVASGLGSDTRRMTGEARARERKPAAGTIRVVAGSRQGLAAHRRG